MLVLTKCFFVNLCALRNSVVNNFCHYITKTQGFTKMHNEV